MILILTGGVHSGKTSLLKNAIAFLQGRQVRLAGYLSEPVREGERILGYDLVEIGGGRFPFLRAGRVPDRQQVGPFFLEREGLRQAERIIRQAPQGDLLIVDEVGPLELEGRGVRPALEKALSSRPGPVLLVIRESILDELVASLGLQSARVIPVGRRDAADELAGLLLKFPA
ncbi:MAG TPA: nucleoside-triphosphatase [Acidobacteriota bacterium]